MWSRDALLFAILLALLHLTSRLPAEGGSQPLLTVAGILGTVAFAVGTLRSVAAAARPPQSDSESA